MNFITVPLDSTFSKQRQAFSCGTSPEHVTLNNYIHIQAKQDVRRNLAVCYIWPDENHDIIGYYTISSSSIRRDILPNDIIRRIPVYYTHLPVFLIGRLARDIKFKGKGTGETLIMDALQRCYDFSMKVGSMAVVVDPIDQNAINFYKKFYFILIPDNGRMFLEMDTIKRLFS